MLKITLNAGLAGCTQTQRRTVKALGLGKFGSCAFHADSPTIRGMVTKVNHLITVVTEEQGSKKTDKKEEKKTAAKK